MKFLLLSAAFLAVAAAQNQQYTTPIPILKQINRHNEDGSYSYGYEAADGSFKIESKYPNGEVYGKYGYVDDQGQVREIEYGASRRGFEPAGNEINVPPPTLQQNPEAIRPLGANEEDDGQYREDPSVYYKDDKYSNTNNQQAYRFNQVNYDNQPQYQQPQQQQPTYTQPQRPVTQHGFLNSYQQPTTYQAPQPAYRPQPQPQPQQSYQPSYQPAPVQPRYFNPAHPNFNPFGGHPAQNFDVNSGSYSVNYKR